MIVHYNVCDHCGQQTQIEDDKEQHGFEFFFYSLELKDSLKGNKFSPKFRSATFCQRECLVEFLKVNLEMNGRLKE